MVDVSFASFNSRSFEQFAQALGAQVLGQGLLIFGDGPDGGREAAYDGTVPYPTVCEPWDGYIVMQAKFRQSQSDSQKDPEWLIAQLKAEMDQLIGHPDRRMPDYYLLVTNVKLSGVTGGGRKGGQQKLEEAFEKHCKPLGIKHLEIWHAERIGVLLDGTPELHRSYEAWLTPREVLSAAFRYFSSRQPDFGVVMTRYLQREFRAQRDTRLREAGHVGEGGPSLEDVFIDLPCLGDTLDPISTSIYAPANTGIPEGVPTVVEALLGRLALKLDPSTLDQTWPVEGMAAPARHLLLGGPGQGKSTVSQFLGQVARWRLLASEPRGTLSRETMVALDNFGQRARELGIELDGVKRYPVRIDLPSFADAADKSARNGQRLSLLAYVSQHIGQTADSEIAVEDVRNWLRFYPWLLLLDGLDEVPPSGNRKAVLVAITDFWDEAAALRADVAMIVTSRPQGYHDDLDPRFYLKVELAQLDSVRALKYAERLALLRLSDPERRNRVLDRLRTAAASPATAALMISPLQVAILFQLVDQRGQAPTDRWSLFHEYLATVMKREQEKPGPSGETMRRWARQVQTLVRRAGLLLHSLAEADGAASPHLTVEQLSDLVRDLLREDGHSETEAGVIAQEVIVATTDRLAFLEQRAEGRYAFEVRSLQEYAAAAALMSGKEASIIRRLKAIAGYGHWQHVYRIAASKAFADPDAEIYRETIIGINRGLDETDVAARVVHLGACMSLDLLDDSLATDQPVYRRQLLTHAIDIANLGRSAALERLTPMLAEAGVDFAGPLLRAAVTSGAKGRREAGWQVLFEISHTASWASSIIHDLLPLEPERLAEAIACLDDASAETWFETLASSGAPVPLAIMQRALGRRERMRFKRDAKTFLGIAPLNAIMSTTVENAKEIAFLGNSVKDIAFFFNTIEDIRKVNWWSSSISRGWRITPLVAQFMADPSAESLAAFAGGLSDCVCEEARIIALPWILATVVAAVRDHDTEAVSLQCAQGLFGGPDEWAQLERRLFQDGMSQADLDLWATGKFFDGQVPLRGAPMISSVRRSRLSTKSKRAWPSLLLSATLAAPQGEIRELLAFVLGLAITDGLLEDLSGTDLSATLLNSSDRWLRPRWLQTVPAENLETAEFMGLLSEFVRKGRVTINDGLSATEHEKSLLRQAVDHNDPNALVILCCWLGGTSKVLCDMAPKLANLAETAVKSPVEMHRSTAACIQVMCGTMEAAEALRIVFSQDHETCGMHLLMDLAKSDQLTDELRKEILAKGLGLGRLIDVAPNLHEEVADELNRMLDARSSGLQTRGVWSQLDLPSSLFDRFEAVRVVDLVH